MKKILILLTLLSLVGCAGQSAVQSVGNTLISMHDIGKTGAMAASAACEKKAIPDDLCKKLLASYEVFRKSWPIVDDAWLVYAKAPATDTLAATTFAAANAVWSKDYADLMALLAQTGLIKPGVTP